MQPEQLKLFEIAKPEWESLTTKWLFDYLVNRYPELKFKIDKYFDYLEENKVEEERIVQTLHKKVQLDFYISKYDRDCAIPKLAGKTFIGVFSGQLFGNWCGSTDGFDSYEELEERLPRKIENFYKNIEEFKKRKEKNIEEE